MGIECDLHHRDHRHSLGETWREHNHNTNNKMTCKWDNDMSLRSIVVSQQKNQIINLNPRAQQKQKTAYRSLLTMCYWEDVTCVLWSCRYGRAVIRSCLPAWEKASWGEEEREMARSRREKETTDKSQHLENIAAIRFIFLQTEKVDMCFMMTLCFAKLHHLRKRG